MTTTRGIDVAGLERGRVSLTVDELVRLDSSIEGGLLRAGDDGWDDVVAIWNGMVRKAPALVVQPASASDVSAVVDFAREHGLLISVKGGGHHIAGLSIADGGLTLDMSRLREVDVDRQARRVHVGAGCLLGDVDRATQAYGLATTLGFVSKTGVAGLTLGGGFGYLSRRFGWTVDNLVEVEIVTADGVARRANRDENADLFWALRGGGGNFGVVTRFTFRLHEVGPNITGGLVIWEGDRADEVLEVYRAVTQSAPREMTVAAMLRLAPPAPFIPEPWHGKPIAGMLICHSGPNPQADLAPIRTLGDPIVDTVMERPYTQQQSMLDDMNPDGANYYWKTEFLPGLPDGYLRAFREQAFESPSPMSYSIIFHLAGALNERHDEDGAVGNRDAKYISGFSGEWPADAPNERNVAWVRESWNRIRRFSTGGNYVNFQVAEDDEQRTREAYRKTFDRLRRLKAKYDPGNLFRVNRNIVPL